MTKLLAGRYEVGRPLGSGAFGFVYEARDVRTNTGVALKIIPLTQKVDDQFRRRLAREIQHGYQVESDYVAKLLDLVVTSRQVILVLELVQGRTLYSLLESGEPLDLKTKFSFGRQIASGVGALHEKKIVHRDLKLENIALSQSGIIKILDLGSSIVASTAEVSSRVATSSREQKKLTRDRATKQGKVVGTLHYMCPHYLTTGTFDHRADIYAFGIIMYELLCQKFPFEFSNIHELLQAKVEGVFPPIREFSPECPAEVAKAIEGAMSAAIDSRPPHIQVLEGIFAEVLRSDLPVQHHLIPEERRAYRRPGRSLLSRPLRFRWRFPLLRYIRFPLPERMRPGVIDYGHPTFFSSLYELIANNLLGRVLLLVITLSLIILLVVRADRVNFRIFENMLQNLTGFVEDKKNSNSRFFAPDPEKASSEVLKSPKGQSQR